MMGKRLLAWRLFFVMLVLKIGHLKSFCRKRMMPRIVSALGVKTPAKVPSEPPLFSCTVRDIRRC